MKKPYDAAMFLQLNNTCNLDCVYCISRGRPLEQKNVDLKKFEKFLKNLDRTFLFIYEGDGEPTLQPQILEISKLIIKYDHYIAITSNMTSKAVAKIAHEIPSERIDYVLASAHTEELEKKGLLQTYFDNCNLFKKKGVFVTCLEIGYPALIPEIKRLKKLFKKNGLQLQFDHFRGSYQGRKYPLAYSKKELKAFNLDLEVKDKFNVFCKYCNAGFNFFAAEFICTDGDIFRCRMIRKPIGNLWSGSFTIDKKPRVCLKSFCTNPYTFCNSYLHEQMLLRTNGLRKENFFSVFSGKLFDFIKEIARAIDDFIYKSVNRFKGLIGKILKPIAPAVYKSAKRFEKKLSCRKKK